MRHARQGKTFLVTRTRFPIFAWGGMGNGFPIGVQLNAFFFFNICLTALGLSCGMWDLVPCPGIKPGPLALGVRRLSVGTTMEVPECIFITLYAFSAARKASMSCSLKCLELPFPLGVCGWKVSLQSCLVAIVFLTSESSGAARETREQSVPCLSRSRSHMACAPWQGGPTGLGSSCFLAIQPASGLGEAASPEAQVCTSVFSTAFSCYYLVNSSIQDTKDSSA